DRWDGNQALAKNISKREVHLAGFDDHNKLYEIIRNKVHWDKLVWFSQCIPRHTFILWLAIKEKLVTQDKIIKWYPQKVVCCPFGQRIPDSHEHLFFQCKPIAEVWKIMKGRARIKTNVVKWADIIKDMAETTTQNSIWNIIGKLCLAATVCVAREKWQDF
ncbi:RNA-directed DNA polymerase, eukaryota, reverse transcriptase zinc-binding domain protein, partial [Tanacetum coccineum]